MIFVITTSAVDICIAPLSSLECPLIFRIIFPRSLEGLQQKGASRKVGGTLSHKLEFKPVCFVGCVLFIHITTFYYRKSYTDILMVKIVSFLAGDNQFWSRQASSAFPVEFPAE